MATAVGSIAGNALLPGIGGVIGGIIGSLADSYLLSGMFKQGPLEGPRLDDLRIQLRAEGSPLARVHGRRVRIAGVSIWTPTLTEEASQSTVGETKGGGGGQQITDFAYYMNTAVMLADTRHLPGGKASAIVKLWANNKLIYDADETDPDAYTYDDLRFITGDPVQAPDSLIVATEGADTPAYRHRCGFVIERLNTAEYGTNINFEALIEPEATAPSVATVISRELELGGMTAEQYDVSGISDSKVVEGLGISGPQSPASVIAALQTAYNVVHSTWGGKLRFYDRGNERTVVALGDSMKDTGSNGPSPVKRTRLGERDLPSSISVTFFEASCDYQQSSRSVDSDGLPGQGTVDITMPLVLTGGEASNIAHTSMWTTRGSTIKWSANLPPSFCDLSENEILLWTDNNNVQRRLRVLDVTEGANFEVEASGVIEQDHTFDQTDAQVDDDRTCDPGDAPGGATTGLQYLVYDGPPLHEDAYYKYGVYRAWADGSETFQPRWFGYRYVTRYGDTGYNLAFLDQFPTMLGTLVTDLPPAEEASNGGMYFERGTTVQVNMLNNAAGTRAGTTDSLQTRAEEDVAGGLNTLIVESDDGSTELLGYTTATDLGSGLWELGGLLRGLRGTEAQALAGATAGARMASANELAKALRGRFGMETIAFYEVVHSQLNTPNSFEAYFKARNDWEVFADKPEVQASNRYLTKQLIRPAEVLARRDDDGNILIGVRRRPRAIWEGFMEEGGLGFYEHMDNSSPSQNYMRIEIEYMGVVQQEMEVDLYFSTASDKPTKAQTDWTSETTLRQSGLNPFTYTAAQQTSDGVPHYSQLTVRAWHTHGLNESPVLEVTI